MDPHQDPHQDRQVTPTSVGALAPNFSLAQTHSARIALHGLLGQPVVLVFYPLAFSAVCSHQLPELQKHLPAFEQAGAVVYGISVDSHHANAAFARSLGLTFPLLSDWKREVSAAYGVLVPEAGYSGRATFVIGKDGRLLWREIADDMGSMDQIPSPERALAAITRG